METASRDPAGGFASCSPKQECKFQLPIHSRKKNLIRNRCSIKNCPRRLCLLRDFLTDHRPRLFSVLATAAPKQEFSEPDLAPAPGVDGYRAGNQIDQTTPTWGWRLRRSRFLRIRNPSSQVKGSRTANLIGSAIRDPWPGLPDQVRNRFAVANLRSGHLTTPNQAQRSRRRRRPKTMRAKPTFLDGRRPESGGNFGHRRWP